MKSYVPQIQMVGRVTRPPPKPPGPNNVRRTSRLELLIEEYCAQDVLNTHRLIQAAAKRSYASEAVIDI